MGLLQEGLERDNPMIQLNELLENKKKVDMARIRKGI